MTETKSSNIQIRDATKDDVPAIIGFIRELAIYEKLEHEMKATPDILSESLFPSNPKSRLVAEAVVASFEGKDVGFALFFHNFSTWEGKKGLYLEDLYVQQAYRGKGIGKELLIHLSKLAVERDCGRFEWSALGTYSRESV